MANAVALAGILFTIVTGFAVLTWRFSKLELKLDLMWDWYLKSHVNPVPGGRRRTDPPAP